MLEMQATIDQIDQEIAAIEAANAERAEQITTLTAQNEAATGRIGDLRNAKLAIETARERLREIGPLLGTPTIAPASGLATVEKRRRGPHMKKYIIPMLATAGTVGVTAGEIVELAKRLHHVDLLENSVGVFLYKLHRDAGTVEQTAEKRWRNVVVDPAQQAAA